mmetsp:Transcript_22342/g.47075  ORF Transcript_22342/g.47075 Transcript_22342/m.47075 type:complete len:217 (+) Transcript_22342:379-1029(+)
MDAADCLEVWESLSGNNGSVDHASNGNHGQTSILQLLQLHLLLLGGISGVQSQRIKSKITGSAIEGIQIIHGSNAHGLGQSDPKQNLFHTGIQQGIVGVQHVGNGLERELLAGDANEFGHHESDGGEHGLTSVLQLRLAEPVEPLGGALGESHGIEVLGGFVSPPSEGHGFRSLPSHESVGEFGELGGTGSRGGGGKGGCRCGEGNEGGDGLHGWS